MKVVTLSVFSSLLLVSCTSSVRDVHSAYEAIYNRNKSKLVTNVKGVGYSTNGTSEDLIDSYKEKTGGALVLSEDFKREVVDSCLHENDEDRCLYKSLREEYSKQISPFEKASEAKKAAKEAKEFQDNLQKSGCANASLEISRHAFREAMDYYKPNPLTVTESPESWNYVSSTACVNGYVAGKSGASKYSLDQYLGGYNYLLSNEYMYKAVIMSAYYGYKVGSTLSN